MQTQRPLVLTGMALEAFLVRGPGERVNLTQTEDIQFKLDGLVLLVERAAATAMGKSSYSTRWRQFRSTMRRAPIASERTTFGDNRCGDGVGAC